MKPSKNTIAVFLVANVLAVLGCTHEVDHISAFVMQTTQALSWLEVFQLYHLPEPMDDFGFRPISVMLMKAFAMMTGAKLAMAPMWLIYLKGMLSCTALGWAILVWQKAHGYKQHSLLVPILVMISAPQLFSIWRLSELDSIGTAALLLCSANLSRVDRTRKDSVLLVVLLILCAAIKESIAISAFVIFFIEALLRRHKEPNHAKKTVIWVGITAVIWLICVKEMIIGDQASRLGEASFSYRMLIAQFTSLQIIHLISLSGCLLICLYPFLTRFKKQHDLLLILSAILLFFTPPLVSLNHYETLYYSPRSVALIFGIASWVGLLVVFVKPHKRVNRHLAAYPLSLLIVFCTVIFISDNIREDFAARLFLPAYPALLILLLSLYGHFTNASQKSMSPWIIKLLLFNVCWHIASTSFNTTAEKWSRDTVNWNGLQKLMAEKPENQTLYYNDFERELSPFFLIQLGANAGWANSNRYQYLPTHMDKATTLRIPSHMQALTTNGEKLYWLGQKSFVSEKTGQRLMGEFNWSDFDYFNENGEEQITPLRFQEDLRKDIYSSFLPTQMGPMEWGISSDYHLVTTSIFEIPRRFLIRLPVIEKRRFSAMLIELKDSSH